MKIISFKDINNMGVEPTQCFEWVEEMIANKGSSFLPAKTHMNMPGNVFCNVMPCIINMDGIHMGG